MKLTKLEKLFLKTFIKTFAKSDGSNSIFWGRAKYVAEICNMSINTLKGVFGSLEKKGIIYLEEIENKIIFNGHKISYIKDNKLWYFNMPICADNYKIATIQFIENRLNSKKHQKYLQNRG